MRFKLVEVSDASCRLTEKTSSCSTGLTIPLPADDLRSLLASLLKEPERRYVDAGPVRIERLRDGPRVHAGVGMFPIPYAHALALVLDLPEGSTL